MNKEKLKRTFIILKSQKLIKRYDIEIEYKNDLKIYKTYFENYNGKSFIINFPYNLNKNKSISDIKNLIYENYIKY